MEVALIDSNTPEAGILGHAEDFGVPTLVLNRTDFYKSERILNDLKDKEVDIVVLAGFLWLVPEYLVKAYPDNIINIHPALLPKYGGKGMYGHHVHEAVKINGEKISGMTIHLVNEQYDKGRILFQAEVEILVNDSAEDIAAKVLKLEHKHYPQIIESYISERESR